MHLDKLLTKHKDIMIRRTASVKEALKMLDQTSEKVLLVTDSDERLLGTLSDGDVRRHILKGGNLDVDISGTYNETPVVLREEGFSTDLAKKKILQNHIGLLPVVTEDNKIVGFVTWDQLFADGGDGLKPSGKVNVPVVIMAGGKGTRMDPFTRILPKALIPVGEKPVAELIIDRFRTYGVNDFILTINHKAEMIKSYFDNIADKDYSVKYVKEEKALGTCGSLKLLDETVSDTFIVSNCDVIVQADFHEVLRLHREQGAILSVLSSIQHYRIPYGVVNYKEGGTIVDIVEKPEYTFTVLTGVYVLERESLEFIPRDEYFDITDLIRLLIENGKKVVMYPVNEKDYIDMGQWEEYKKSLDFFHGVGAI